MQCMNGVLIMTPEEKASIESAIGPITSYNVEDVRLRLINEIEKKEADGFKLWAEMMRITLAEVSAFAGYNA